MLFQEMSKIKRSWIMTSILFMAIGIIMLICPESFVNVLVAALGYILIIFATVLELDFIASRKVLINYIYLGIALLIEVAGLAILFYRQDVLAVLGFLFGVLLVLEGLYELFNTWMYARRAQRKGWQVLIVMSILLIASGVIIFQSPWWETPGALMKVIGAMMLFTSAVGIVHVIMVWPFRTEYEAESGK